MGMILKKELESNIKTLQEVSTRALLSSITSPTSGLKVIVISDETHSGKKALYEYTTAWNIVALLADMDHQLIFTDDRNMYMTNANKQPIKIGDLLPFVDIDDIEEKNPAILNKLYMTEKGKLYFYNKDGVYKLVSGGGGSGGGTNRLDDVATKALITTTYPKPDDFDSVVVLADETTDGQSTWYFYTGTEWAYQGIYFDETVEAILSDRNIRTVAIAPNVDYTIPLKYLVGKKHLEIYIEGELLVRGIDYTEVGTDTYSSNKVQFKTTVPKEARLIFKRVLSTFSGDSMISRMSAEGWLKYANTSWAGLNALVTSLGFDTVTKTINVDATSGAVVKTVPSNCNIGTRLLYRKVDATVNGVTINMPTGEKVTKANLSSLTLTSCDDFWELEKVTQTRWVLRDGCESGSTTEGTWIRDKLGTQREAITIASVGLTFVATYGTIYGYASSANINFPKAFLNNSNVLGGTSKGINNLNWGVSTYAEPQSVTSFKTSHMCYNGGVTSCPLFTEFIGRWY